MGHASLAELGRHVAEGWARFLGGAAGGETIGLPGGVLGMAGEPFDQMNTGYVVGPERAGETLTQFAQRLRERRLPGLLYAASPVEAEAEAAAGRLGLRPAGSVPLMWCRAAEAHRDDDGPYTVSRVVDVAGMRLAADVLADAYGIEAAWCERMMGPTFPALPDAAMFLAFKDDKAVAACGTGRVGGAVGLYAVGTRQARRRRGAGRAAVAGALDYHIGAGAHVFGLLSAPQAEGLYAAVGFAPVDAVAVWCVDSV